MGICAEQIQDILQHINAQNPLCHGRRALRVTVQMNVEVTPCVVPGSRPAQRLPARLANISARGAQILHSQPLAVGTQVLLHIPRCHRGEATILADVIYCRPASAQKYRIGMHFIAAASQPSSANAEAEIDRIRASILR